MEDKSKIPLTAAEMSGLWTQFMNDSLAVCVNRYFLETVNDEEVRPIIEFTIHTAKRNITIMQDIFKKDDFPIPMGFTDQDVNPKAPKLFSDTFVLTYLRHMSILAMQASGGVLGLVTRPDVVTFHKSVLNAGVELQDLTRNLLLKQGTYIKPPYITTPDAVEFVKQTHYLSGFWGKKRAVTSVEISHLFFNVKTNAIGKALITGFAQIAKDKEVKQFFVKGMKLAQDHIDIFSNFLKEEGLPVPMSWDANVSDCTSSIFSDKLLMFHIAAMNASGIGNYAMAMAASPRRDIALKYASLIPEVSLYAEDGAKIMIKKGWLEEPPQADDRQELIQGH
ncbi:hypothetical protein BABA_12151 [Neobacillus bataviensis LMG 21833]|uniref:DUF3231 family protein n=1 Tax=Neobacillus bataviensis LMG 21833 TaxID=1117379 RepID=K6DKW6_9BACI|nr:DUF3231 family protein [Neobacillus bataviensis]EKN68803.1 hypothetical protein BABA_12151 [Neobacillus bataviensis LMG 21833]